ncbi:MAG: diphthine--ammonia ligase [Acidilobaceae archaeon]|nr:diphthine--ammonia ligase [Acidilobaceae archaeon]
MHEGGWAPLRFCALLSGGKDSSYALYIAMQRLELACTLTLKPKREDSWMFHYPAVELVRLQAEAMGIGGKAFFAEVSGEKEKEVEELELELSKLKRAVGFEAVLAGAIASVYQRSRLERVAASLGLRLELPLWGSDQEEHMRRLVKDGFRFVIVSATTMGLPRQLVGVTVGEREVEKIIALSRRYGFNAAFEGGEAETLVVDSPLFGKALCLRGRRVSRGDFEHRLKIEEAWLGGKGEECVFVSG